MNKIKSLITQYRGLRREIYILFIGRIVTNFGSMVWPVMTLIMSRKLGMDAKTIALFLIVCGLFQLPFNLIGGKLADIRNKKHIIVVCDSISIVLFLIGAALPISYATLVLILIAATAQAMEGPSYEALLADLSLTKDRERAYSLEYLGNNLGLMLAPTIAGLLFKRFLWLSFLLCGCSIAVSTLLIGLLIKDITPMEESGEDSVYQKAKEGSSIWQVLSGNKLILLYIFVMAMFWGAYNQYGFLMPLDMGRVHGDDGAVIFGTVSSLNCIEVVLFTPILTKLLEKVRKTAKILLGIVFVIAGYAVFLQGLGILPMYYLAIFLFTLGEILVTTVSGAYLTERIPASHRGRVNSFISVLSGIIIDVMQFGAGFLFDEFGSVSAWIMILGVLMATLLGCIALLLIDRHVYRQLYIRREDESGT
ncbi:MAG: MFS transporter [Lachnospiraceae bacterium]|nr:MFS transporter [Lachnospiraceae bacterium]